MEVVRVPLDQAEYAALERLAEQSLRSAPNELRAILRDRLRQAGLMESKTVTAKVERGGGR